MVPGGARRGLEQAEKAGKEITGAQLGLSAPGNPWETVKPVLELSPHPHPRGVFIPQHLSVTGLGLPLEADAPCLPGTRIEKASMAGGRRKMPSAGTPV